MGKGETQQQRRALSVTKGALVNFRFGLVTTQKSLRRVGEGSLPRSLNSLERERPPEAPGGAERTRRPRPGLASNLGLTPHP